MQGDATDPVAVERVVQGTDAVLLTLGHTKTSPKDVQAVATRHIVAAMRKHNVKRLVSLTGAGVRDSKDAPKLVDKVFGFLLKRLSPDVLADGEQHAAIIRSSDLDWVIVRGPRLTQGPRTGKYRVGYVGKDSGISISRADLAEFMLKQATDTSYLRSMPMVSY